MNETVCETCGDKVFAIGLNARCINCRQIEHGLGKYLKSAKGVDFVKENLDKAIEASKVSAIPQSMGYGAFGYGVSP